MKKVDSDIVVIELTQAELHDLRMSTRFVVLMLRKELQTPILDGQITIQEAVAYDEKTRRLRLAYETMSNVLDMLAG